jgi:hypothetical protein
LLEIKVRCFTQFCQGGRMPSVHVLFIVLRALCASRGRLVTENLLLRQQLIVLQRSVKRPRIQTRDRLVFVWLSRLWRGWRSALLIVQPETLVAWHRLGFRLYW